PELIADDARRHAALGRDFRVLDLLASPLPAVDLVLCRDCLVHLSFADIARAVANLRRSGSRWLLTTTFPAQDVNEDVVTGDWRPINLQAAPFDWPAPEELLVEQCTEADGRFADKSLGLWRLDALPGTA
ncbi:MAG TPA: class I SAM-dependent methyltransferase, partial [Gemmatimonadales bacterium]|nr:class I SAM-dependent methyltransferase [Gemmatimonadales bacterium]